MYIGVLLQAGCTETYGDGGMQHACLLGSDISDLENTCLHCSPAQSKQSTPWIARLPVDGLSAPAAFKTSTSPVAPAHRDMLVEDTGPDVSKGSNTLIFKSSR